jgi:hypothetical protein
MKTVPQSSIHPFFLNAMRSLPAGLVSQKTDVYYDNTFVQPATKHHVELPPASDAELAGLRAEFTPKLARCEDCSTTSAEIIVTPDPLFGKTPNEDAGHIGYYAVRCTHTDCLSCGIPVPGDRWFHNTLDGQRSQADQIPTPVTLEDHRAAIENAVAVWNGQ